MSRAPRWAIAQPRMHVTLAGNLAETLAALEAAAAAGADGLLSTELALTGFHRRVPELLDVEALADAERQLRAACARLALPASSSTAISTSTPRAASSAASTSAA
ncbi:hypothetical protein [Pelomonas sp. Root1444]|uniref:hypothetical protein n=1 Tax=Pelomonas sp. Root1444 TaxID=1736464 RepID=UPI000702A57F|nr:hypothetical protein [Pelomonas sp. Root1444]KQY89131.1 hypothetical protein ASD35_16655 [Pelomonas sp. Root1444]